MKAIRINRARTTEKIIERNENISTNNSKSFEKHFKCREIFAAKSFFIFLIIFSLIFVPLSFPFSSSYAVNTLNTPSSIPLSSLLNPDVNTGSPSDYSLSNIEKILPDAITRKTVTEEQTLEMDVIFQIGKKEYEKIVKNESTGESYEDTIQIDVSPYIDPKAWRTLAPLRYSAEALGANVRWDGRERKVTVTDGENTVEFFVPKYDKKGKPIDPQNYEYYVKNGEKIEMDIYPQIKEGRTFLPLRYLAQSLGADVKWDGKEKKITLTKQTIKEIEKEKEEINWSYKVNGVSLEERKNLCMPLNKSVSSLMSDKDLAEYLEEKGLTLTSETKNGLPILADALLNLNPKVSDNILKGISDRSVLGYLASYDGKESVSGKNDLINLLNKNISELNSKYSMKSALTIIKGVLKASDLGYVKPLKTYEEVLTVSESLKEMMDNRLYKEDDKGGKITLEDLIDEDRVMTFAALNSLHNDVKANLLLSQSRELAELTKKGELSQVKDFLDIIYSAMNSTVNIEGEDVKEEDTVPFKQVIEQLDPADWEMNNKADFLLNTYNKLKEMNISVKNNPKLFFALSLYRSLLANNYKTVSDSDKEKITEMLTTSAARTFEYLTKVQKFREAINSKDTKTIDNLLNNYFGFQNQSKQDQEAIMKGIEFMIKEGVSNINYQNRSIMTLGQLYSLDVNRLKWINQALKKGESLYGTLTQNIDFSTEDITKTEQSLFLRLLEISGHKVRDIIEPNNNEVSNAEWSMLKNPDMQLNILNYDNGAGVISIISGFSFFYTMRNFAGGLWPTNKQSLVEKRDYKYITDWKDTHNLQQLLTALTGPLTAAATPETANPTRLRPPVRYGVNDIEQIFLNLLGVPTVEIYGGRSYITGKTPFWLYFFSGSSSDLEVVRTDFASEKIFLQPTSIYQGNNKAWKIDQSLMELFNNDEYDRTDKIHETLPANVNQPFVLTLFKIPNIWKQNKEKITEDKLFYLP